VPDGVLDCSACPAATTYLIARQKGVFKLPEGVLERFTALRSFDAGKNVNLTSFPAGLFAKNAALVNVDISWSALGAFGGAPPPAAQRTHNLGQDPSHLRPRPAPRSRRRARRRLCAQPRHQLSAPGRQ